MSLQTFNLTVQTVNKETADTVSIHFQNPENEKLVYKPGQFLTLIVNINGKEERRAYSLCSSPYTDEFPAVAVKRIKNGLVSNYLFDNLKAGDTIQVLAPMGNFVLEPQTSKKRHVVLFGAGSGVTPLFSMLKSILAAEPQSFVSLVYGNRSVDSIIFRNQLEDLMAKHPSRFRLVHSLSNPPEKWYGAIGRLSSSMIKEMLYQLQPASPIDSTLYFMCGPQGMMETISDTLKKLKVNKEDIFHESFFSNVDETDKLQAIADEGIVKRQVTVLLDGEKFAFNVEPEQTILEAGLDQDIDMPYSCQSGLCTACRGRCLSGQVHMDETDGLSDKEIELGYVLTCVSHPLTADVVIEIG